MLPDPRIAARARSSSALAWCACWLAAACSTAADGDVDRVQSEGLHPAEAGAQSAAEADRYACEANFKHPPPDCEPSAPTSWDIDCDGDGAPGAQMTACDPEQLLIHSSVSPPGRFDCDDSANGIHPMAVEVWADGTDSDCDGREAPTCRALEAGNYSMGERQATQECEGPAVVVGDVVACPHRCDGGQARVFFFLENRGSEAADAEATVHFADSQGGSGRYDTAVLLGPGEVSDALAMEYDPDAGIRLQVEPGGCAEQLEFAVEPLDGPCVR